ncbi:DUF4190 domain-containing protein [Leucobacter triazinivorans]|uniref:DUF4190 domain-containing protein n=1 Tax=Leucobacter triazinivorans TaxID=1784719 RepID=A0A4P6KHM7_9MICO|nr:DUF4190 domain-containing protein [Leucobacter triazinivorans]QBE49872.1 DUF4190 domain-containing protein [Leucobacter triazinivorans]
MSDPTNPGNSETPEQPTTPLPSTQPAQPTQPAQAQPHAPHAAAVPPAPQPGQQPGFAAAPPVGGAPPQPPVAGPPNAYPQPVGAPQAPLNALALVSFIGSFFVSLVGIICGHIALSQIKRRGERGRGFALAGTIIGYVALAGTILAVIVGIAVAGAAVKYASDLSDSSIEQLERQLEELDSLPGTGDQFAEDGTALPDEFLDGSDSAGGDERSAEFCAVFTELSDYGASDGTADAQALEAFRKLAEIESPNQSVYQRFYAYVQNPLADENGDIEALMNDYFEAAMADGLACL